MIDIDCDGDWFACRAGWLGKCVDSKKCLIEFLDDEYGEGTYEKLKKAIKEGVI